jgi:hypothetical protein
MTSAGTANRRCTMVSPALSGIASGVYIKRPRVTVDVRRVVIGGAVAAYCPLSVMTGTILNPRALRFSARRRGPRRKNDQGCHSCAHRSHSIPRSSRPYFAWILHRHGAQSAARNDPDLTLVRLGRAALARVQHGVPARPSGRRAGQAMKEKNAGAPTGLRWSRPLRLRYILGGASDAR